MDMDLDDLLNNLNQLVEVSLYLKLSLDLRQNLTNIHKST